MTTREAFEKWAIEAGYLVERIAYDPDNFLSGQYKSILTNTRWAAWQAATAAALERAAEVCVDISAHQLTFQQRKTAATCAEAIRALKEQP